MRKLRKEAWVILALLGMLIVAAFAVLPVLGIAVALPLLGMFIASFFIPIAPILAYKSGDSPLHTAALRNDTDMVKTLIEQGVDVDAQNKDGQAPLHIAACLGYVEIIRMLINAGANLNVRTSLQSTPLHGAVWWDQRDSDSSGIMTLGNNIRAIALLLDAGADPSAKDANGLTPLDTMDEDSPLYKTPIWWRLHDLQNKSFSTSDAPA